MWRTCLIIVLLFVAAASLNVNTSIARWIATWAILCQNKHVLQRSQLKQKQAFSRLCWCSLVRRALEPLYISNSFACSWLLNKRLFQTQTSKTLWFECIRYDASMFTTKSVGEMYLPRTQSECPNWTERMPFWWFSTGTTNFRSILNRMQFWIEIELGFQLKFHFKKSK